MATQFVKEGVHVMLTSRDGDKLAKVKDELKDVGRGKVEYCVCDITQPNEIKQLVKQTREELGTIDILVNNAGTSRWRV